MVGSKTHCKQERDELMMKNTHTLTPLIGFHGRRREVGGAEVGVSSSVSGSFSLPLCEVKHTGEFTIDYCLLSATCLFLWAFSLQRREEEREKRGKDEGKDGG